MQIALQFYANHPNIIFFEPESGFFRVVPKADSNSTEKLGWGGWGVVIHERLYGLFKSQGRLSLIVDNQPTPLDERISSFWHAEGRKRKIEIRADAKPMFQFDYEQEEVDGLVYAMTTWDEEDHDFWLFLHNVINDQERQARIAPWSGP